jgi:Zn-dependent M16 (insulinase) family peptidase
VGTCREDLHEITLGSLDPAAKSTKDLVTTKILPIDTNFVGLAIRNRVSPMAREQQALRVAAQLLANEYLHRRVREEGGAYGSTAAANLSGQFGGVSLGSYRDPSPDKTAEAFREAAAWMVSAGNVTEKAVDEAKLRLFSKIDAPYSADSFGEALFIHRVTPQLRQSVRETLLDIGTRDVLEVAHHFDVDNGQHCFAVLKGEASEAKKGESVV